MKNIKHILGNLFSRPTIIGPQEVIVVTPSITSRLVIGPTPVEIIRPATHLLISPNPRGVWEEKGWEIERLFGRQIYRGYFQVRDRNTRKNHRYQGRIENTKLNFTPFIANPPTGIRTHPKGPCFSRISDEWFQVHWHRPPRNVDDAILYIEKVLDEVVN